MFHNIYIFKISDRKIIRKLIKYHLQFEKITYYKNDIYLYVDYYNYHQLLKYQKLFNITFVEARGINKYKYLFRKYFLFFISMFIGIIWLFVLSNLVFDVDIMTNNQELYKILKNELTYYGIDKYHFTKSFAEKETIKRQILNDYKDKIEWLEIDLKGSKYIINVLERIIQKEDNNHQYRHLVAKKNAIILEIKAENGDIIKRVNDYVNKGDIIVSGAIMKKDEVKSYVRCKGEVYGETWYNVEVSIPLGYSSKTYTGKSKKRLVVNYFDKHFKLFNFHNYQHEELTDHIILESKILPFSLSYATIKELRVIDEISTVDKALEQGLILARSRLLETLEPDSKILSQKKLKLYIKDSKIFIEVFFKVYENITDYSDIVLIEGE